ncbi:GntR family transcriptional regulator [Cnuibacter physcomitrellae]|uniref:GntR family transcriptional regulator n=1 Tax=Cnuibacter physcomitrellae TaxID=1619308 RepID=A0A1X9LND9_9MICO|nr:GntR family transcriptional regulator [Cnuibacter physcomitrellae]ARJ06716.1 GntR family transcriptional regulator [Cnuibacter physcomitrellae]GGI38669.1 GntR family transcriptional regulator [Cnuibacter physcomitrellae]
MTIDETRENVASHRIADSLRSSILGGELLPGERIRQEDLADRFGASRIPVREALRVLQADGLVTLVANSGAWVSRLTMAECIEAYQIRERVEPLLLRTSMPNLTETDVAALQTMADLMERDDSVDLFMRTDREFHLATYAGAPPSMLSTFIRRLWNTTQHYRRAYSQLVRAPSIGVTHMEHHLLVDCIRRQDADDAERVLVMHIQRTRLELQKHPEIFE